MISNKKNVGSSIYWLNVMARVHYDTIMCSVIMRSCHCAHTVNSYRHPLQRSLCLVSLYSLLGVQWRERCFVIRSTLWVSFLSAYDLCHFMYIILQTTGITWVIVQRPVGCKLAIVNSLYCVQAERNNTRAGLKRCGTQCDGCLPGPSTIYYST